MCVCRFGSEFGRLCPLADVGLIAQTWQSVKVTALSTVAVADAGRDKSMLRVGDKLWVYTFTHDYVVGRFAKGAVCTCGVQRK